MNTLLYLTLCWLVLLLPPQAPVGEVDPIVSPIPDSLSVQIAEAHQQAICTMDRFMDMYHQHIVRAPDPVKAWNQHPRLRKWMGTLPSEADPAVIRAFERSLQKMQQRLVSGELQYQVDEARKGRCRRYPTNAYVQMADTLPIIYICPRWQNQSSSQRVATLLHELMHTFGHVHPLGTDTPLKARQLARSHPEMARISPENFENMVEYYVCDLGEEP